MKKKIKKKNLKVPVAVVATMSAGKSTFINSLIGKDILLSENQACTGKIYKIINNNKNIIRIDNKVKGSIDSNSLKELNTDSENLEIQVETSFKNLKKKIEIYDTPGVNNFLNNTHGEITYKFLEKNLINKMIYILNASQLGVNDDKEFLLKIKEIYKNKDLNILFLLNKIDVIDEKYENKNKIIKDATIYLENLGFKSPKLIPISAHICKILRKGFDNNLETRREKIEYNTHLEYLKDKQLYSQNQLVKTTGIPAVENFINSVWGK